MLTEGTGAVAAGASTARWRVLDIAVFQQAVEAFNFRQRQRQRLLIQLVARRFRQVGVLIIRNAHKGLIFDSEQTAMIIARYIHHRVSPLPPQ